MGDPKKKNCDVKVTIGRVIRGNPYVERNATPVKGLPDSLPPSQTYEVEIKVQPFLDKDCPDNVIDLSIIGNSADNGSATVKPTGITQTTKVTVTGGDQTRPGNSGKLKIQASRGGKVLAVSAGFTVCAHPLNFGDVYDPPVIDETLQGIHVAGMNVKDSWESDSGQAAMKGILMDLNKVQIKEQLLEPRPKVPPFHPVPFDHSDYDLGQAFSSDRHAIIIPDAGPAADWVISQLSIYKCERCGCKDIVMPNSGKKIIFRVVNANGWQLIVEKVGAQVMVHGRTAGPGNAKVKSDPIPLGEK